VGLVRLSFINKKYLQNSNMVNLKLIGMRLKSVKNIQKITQSMKMVSAAKFARAEKDLKVARPLGAAAKVFYENAEVASDKETPKELYVAITSDRGLAGAVHSSVSKAIRADIEGKDLSNVKILCVGDKSRAFFNKWFKDNLIMVGSEIGRLPPQVIRRLISKILMCLVKFGDASKIANAIMTCGFEFDSGKMLYNKYNTVVSYTTTALPLFSQETIMGAEKITAYDSVDADVIQSYLEFSLASQIFFALKEGATSEQSSRMTAMDSSSKNAGEMIDKLAITYNRTRQAVITGELIEIISGAAAL